MDTKRIFVLGNGFDLAHYLPTAYVHFMDAMMVVESCEEEKQLGFDDLFQKYISGECSNRDKDFFTKTRELYKTDDLRLSIDTVNDLQEKLINNGWFQHFKHHLTDVDTWIDFENEIENSLLSFDFIFNIDFNTSTISDNLNSMYPSTEPDVNIEKILDNEKIFDWRLLNQTGLKVNYFINLLKSFGVLKHVYGHITYEVENKSGRHLNYVRQESKRLTLKDYEVLEEYRERRISEHTTQTNIKKSFNNIVETKYLSRNSTVYTSFNEIEIYNKILKDLELFSKIFTIYINLVINQLKPTKPLDAFGNLKKEIDAVYTFNYSDTFERLYPNSLESQLNQVEVQYIHGSAERKNIVLGISDFDPCRQIRTVKLGRFNYAA
ncbi:AbiH family protein [Psychrobacter immobilis]|uniref:AbiH family protein n=1 Tax=Psychrobacter immobilis TaxID=498 RepID=UPI0019181F86|nr:AbiH family protein [Psychrobacter immobilis]